MYIILWLQIVGNLLYYRYINSTIVAPDAYGVIDIDMEKGGALTPDQRRNLGSVAKILQFAASNKGVSILYSYLFNFFCMQTDSQT